MEGKQFKMKEHPNNQRMEYSLELRKRRIEAIISKSRFKSTSNQNQQFLLLEEEKEEPKKPEEGNLDLNQYKRYYYPRRRGKRCWRCKAWGHLKRNCPQIKCFYCGRQGHTKKRCFKRDLHMAIQVIKKIKQDQEQKQEMLKPKKKQNQTLYDRCKIVEFRQEKNRWIMSYKGMDLADYIGDYPFDQAKLGFENQLLPKWKMEKPIRSAMPAKDLKLSKYLPHQCGADGEVLNGQNFLRHLYHDHRGWVPEGSLINGSPYRYWLLWYDHRNYERFTKNIGEPQLLKAEPPWMAPGQAIQ